MKKKSRKGFRASMIAVMAVLLAVLILGNYLTLIVYPVSVNNVFTVTGSAEADETTSTRADWIALAEEIESEGITLLRNENGTLPLNTDSGTLKVNLLGERAYNPVYGGTGSSAGDTSGAVTLVQALNENGFEVNPALENSKIYNEKKDDDGSGMGFMGSKLELKDVSIEKYTGNVSFESMKEYSDIAIVVFGRSGGEGSDLTSFEQTEGKHYLELSTNEEALIRKATETFDTVIVLYNGANALELGFLETYNVDAALWIGDPGINGFPAVAKVLNGQINPSGRLVDTFAYDATSAPSYLNYGSKQFSNSPELVVEGWLGQETKYFNYVDYVEGIYVGYRWYETAAVEGFLDYDKTVQYPFGYGMSYTTFEQKIVGGTSNGATIHANGEMKLEVEVTNTGSVAGKEVVQAYYTPPYTEYDKANGVEKAAVNLVAYGKTGLLRPGESETVTLTWNVEDMASYDESYDNGDGTFGSYMLDEGTYNISIRSDSHTVITSVDVSLSDQYFYTGENKRSTDSQAAVNQLQDSERGTYLSRKDGFANFDESMNSVTAVASETILEGLNNDGVYDADKYDSVITKHYVEGVDYRSEGTYVAKEGDLTLDDLSGAAYDDERWEKLISQMSLTDLKTLIGNGGWSTAEIASIGKVATVDLDGPTGLNSMFSSDGKGVQYPATIVLAATWNAELPLTFGDYVADEAHSMGVSGWYAPAMNIHRSPFSGRNFEYYSEDPFVSGVVGAQVAYGCRNNGLYTYIKHYALNDQETDRDNRLTTWSNEQASREIYLRPFELTVKNGKASALMSSMNYVGATWAGNVAGLLTEILRDEWGFQGMAITDACTGDFMTNLANVNMGIRVGQDLWLGMGGVDVTLESDADIYYAQRAVKNILYTQCNASLIPSEILPWRTWLAVLDVVMVAGIAVCAVALVKDIRKKNEEN